MKMNMDNAGTHDAGRGKPDRGEREKPERIRLLPVERGLGRREEQPLSRIGIDEKQVFARHKYFTIICD